MADPCQQVHAALRHGQAVVPPSLVEHVASCPACATVVEGGAPLAQALDTAPPVASLEGVWARVQAEVERERGPAAALRSLRTPLRVALVAAVAGLLPGLTLLLWGRGDLHVYPVARLLLDVTVVAVPAALLLAVAMRPLHTRPWPRWLAALAVGLAVLGALIGPMMVPAHHAHPLSLAGTGDDLVRRAVACLVAGAVLGLPLAVVAGLVMRRRGRFGLPVGLAVVLAGLVGTVSIFLHCPLVAPVHLVLGHSTVLLVYLLLALVAAPGRSRSRD
ncbi:MAG: hypothetical protein AB1Z98_07970 [Nannocystaceae bacterium]